MPRNPQLEKYFPWLTPEEERRVELLLWERAAQGFESGGLWRDAADCWLEAGNVAQASKLYAQSGDRRMSARVLLERGQYTAALERHNHWLAGLLPGDSLGRAEALFGQAACHILGSAARVDGLSRASGQALYRQARAIVEQETSPWKKVKAWIMLAQYGTMVRRYDLTQLGYETALNVLSESSLALSEKIETCRLYLEDVRIYGDRTMIRRLEEQLAEWMPLFTPINWDELRQEIESLPFHDNVRDVLHFTSESQWLAWEALSKIERQSDINSYLAALAPEDMVFIPAGTFPMGSPADDRDADSSEKPQHQVLLPGYYIDRFPVTNAEFGNFIRAAGYQDSTLWTPDGWQEKLRYDWKNPRFWNDQRFNHQNQPVVGVSWYEAVAYSNWAKKSLSSEAQWEKAASWNYMTDRKLKYPWGNDWNAQVSSVINADRPNIVGYRSSLTDSPLGVSDMGGGVYEWCSTAWNNLANKPYPYPYVDNDGREDLSSKITRVVRNSRWGIGDEQVARNNARCASRSGDEPGYWFEYRGFRCVIFKKP